MAMAKAQGLAMGARIKRLRQRSGLKQKQVAKALNVDLRRYQAIQQFGTQDMAQVRVLAKLFKADPDWIWDGEKKKPGADLKRLTQINRRLDSIDETLERQASSLAELAADVSALRTRQQRRRPPKERGEGGQADSGLAAARRATSTSARISGSCTIENPSLGKRESVSGWCSGCAAYRHSMVSGTFAVAESESERTVVFPKRSSKWAPAGRDLSWRSDRSPAWTLTSSCPSGQAFVVGLPSTTATGIARAAMAAATAYRLFIVVLSSECCGQAGASSMTAFRFSPRSRRASRYASSRSNPSSLSRRVRSAVLTMSATGTVSGRDGASSPIIILFLVGVEAARSRSTPYAAPSASQPTLRSPGAKTSAQRARSACSRAR